jgi:hypothetical protein
MFRPTVSGTTIHTECRKVYVNKTESLPLQRVLRINCSQSFTRLAAIIINPAVKCMDYLILQLLYTLLDWGTMLQFEKLSYYKITWWECLLVTNHYRRNCVYEVENKAVIFIPKLLPLEVSSVHIKLLGNMKLSISNWLWKSK